MAQKYAISCLEEAIEYYNDDDEADELIIPEELDGIKVKSIGEFFQIRKKLLRHTYFIKVVSEEKRPNNTNYVALFSFYCCPIDKVLKGEGSWELALTHEWTD